MKKRLTFSEWRVFEFIKESNGQFSSARLFAFVVVLCIIIEWQRAIWKGIVWTPSLEEIGIVLGVLGFKFAQKPFESKEQTKKEEEEIR